MRLAFASCAAALCAASQLDEIIDAHGVIQYAVQLSQPTPNDEIVKPYNTCIDGAWDFRNKTFALSFRAADSFCTSKADTPAFNFAKLVLDVLHVKFPESLYEVTVADNMSAFSRLCACSHPIGNILKPTSNIIEKLDVALLQSLPKLTLKLLTDNDFEQFIKAAKCRLSVNQLRSMLQESNVHFQPFITAGLIVDQLFTGSKYYAKIVEQATDDTKALATIAINPYLNNNLLQYGSKSFDLNSYQSILSQFDEISKLSTAKENLNGHPLDFWAHRLNDVNDHNTSNIITFAYLLGHDGKLNIFDRVLIQTCSSTLVSYAQLFSVYSKNVSLGLLSHISGSVPKPDSKKSQVNISESVFQMLNQVTSNESITKSFNNPQIADVSKLDTAPLNVKYFYGISKFAQYVKYTTTSKSALSQPLSLIRSHLPAIAHCIGRQFAFGHVEQQQIDAFNFPCNCFNINNLFYRDATAYLLFGQTKCISKLRRTEEGYFGSHPNDSKFKIAIFLYYYLCNDWLTKNDSRLDVFNELYKNAKFRSYLQNSNFQFEANDLPKTGSFDEYLNSFSTVYFSAHSESCQMLDELVPQLNEALKHGMSFLQAFEAAPPYNNVSLGAVLSESQIQAKLEYESNPSKWWIWQSITFIVVAVALLGLCFAVALFLKKYCTNTSNIVDASNEKDLGKASTTSDAGVDDARDSASREAAAKV